MINLFFKIEFEREGEDAYQEKVSCFLNASLSWVMTYDDMTEHGYSGDAASL